MGNSTGKRPRPTGKVGAVWQPTHTRIMKRTVKDRQLDHVDDTWLPEQFRYSTPQSARTFLRDIGLCGGSAVLLFNMFVLIAAVAPDANPDLALCRLPTLPPAQHYPRQPVRSPLEQLVTLNASLEQFIAPPSTPSPSPCVHRRSTVTSSVFAWRFLPQQEPTSSRLPPYLDPTSELYADAIKYVMPDSLSTSPTSAAASLTDLARATPTLRTTRRNASVATLSQTPTHAVTTPTSSAERAPQRKRPRMTRSGTTPTVSAPEGALELTRANSTPARSQPIETVVSSPSSPSTGIDLWKAYLSIGIPLTKDDSVHPQMPNLPDL